MRRVRHQAVPSREEILIGVRLGLDNAESSSANQGLDRRGLVRTLPPGREEVTPVLGSAASACSRPRRGGRRPARRGGTNRGGPERTLLPVGRDEKAWSHRKAPPVAGPRPLPGATTCRPRPAFLTPSASALKSISNNSALAGHAGMPIWRPRPPPYKNDRVEEVAASNPSSTRMTNVPFFGPVFRPPFSLPGSIRLSRFRPVDVQSARAASTRTPSYR